MVNPDKTVNALWAKKDENNGRYLWLPLTVHLEDTMNVSRWLFANWLSESQRELCIQGLIGCGNREDVTIDLACNLAAFLGGIHDIGKATPAFQTKKGFNNSPTLDDELLCKLEKAGFSGISSIVLSDPNCSHHSVAGEFLLKKYGVKDDIGSIVGGHHGKPIDDPLVLYDQDAYTENYFQSDDSNSLIYNRWSNAQKYIFDWSLRESGFTSAEDLPEISQPVQVIYEGLLIMADWIASNSEYFPLIDIDDEESLDTKVRFQNGMRSWIKDSTIQIGTCPEENILFNDRFGFAPREFQAVVYETVESIEKPGIMILEAPMGLGKTEAALAAAEVLMAKTGSSGIFFGLPTQATSNSMFRRVESWLENLTKYYGTPQSLRLSHGKAALNDDMNRLRDSASLINADESSDESVFVNEWFSGRKKAMLDDFVVGTVDGFLLSALKQKHLALRHLGFSKKVIIIDEVHAYDTYMQQYLEEALRWMGAYGAPVILVSATLPPEKRESLIKSYLGDEGDIVLSEETRKIMWSVDSYPLITYSDGEDIKTQTDFTKNEKKQINVKRLEEDELLGAVSTLLNDGGVLGIIVNTVKRAQELCRKCKSEFGDEVVELLHSSFIATDRVDKESNLVKMIGKNGMRPEKKIIIGTQVIEQSLDIDFDVMITDLCPVDLLLQRAGRLHRHNIERPRGLEEPQLYVMGTSETFDFDHGSEMVYGKYYLIRTQHYLPDVIRIPSDIPNLIQKVYGDFQPNFNPDQMIVYCDSKMKKDVEMIKKMDKALTYRLEDPKECVSPRRNNLIRWLKNPDHSDTEEMAVAQVRDIQETVEVIAVKRTGNGYGTFRDNKDISSEISKSEVAKEISRHTIRIPGYVTRGIGISNTIEWLEEYNKKNLWEWQNQSWLKGELGVIFDEDGEFELSGKCLKYDNEYGLREV